MGTEAPKVGAPSKASPVVSGWRQTIWFLEMSVSRVPLEKISTCFQRPLLNPAAATTIADDSTTGTGASAVVQGAQAVYNNGLFKTPDRMVASGMMSASVRIVVGKAEDVPLVPWPALTDRDAEGRYHVRVRLASGAAVEKRGWGRKKSLHRMALV
ncbi:hypothetical protein [Rhizobium hidalgonense]|uniref:hypothetical protein n=1 Tax=Rhizobium hidalgonense TaxID=1538159 RepID=UPI0028714127|nr:hypothetical protein [Rhizobium hidalgonense]MDR9805734.1 hypothetical protein [Rhizobium hidalgonense]